MIGRRQGADPDRSPPQRDPALRRVRLLFLMSFGHLVGHWYIGLLMLVLPLLKEEFSLTFTEVGLLISLRALAGAAGNSVSGFFADLFGTRTRILLASAMGGGLCWLLVGFSHVYLFVLILVPLFTLFNAVAARSEMPS